MLEVLEITLRDTRGKLNSRRLRRDGRLPAVLYGHGQEPLSLIIAADQLRATLRHGAQVVQLQGAAEGQALLQEVQWDTFQQHVLHVDLLRVDAKDRVKIEVPVVVRGEAPGEHEGGVVELLVHSVEIETSPAAIPEQLVFNVNELHIGSSLKARDIEGLPEGASVLGDPTRTLVQCVEPTVVPEEEEVLGSEAAEPEILGRKADDDQEGKTE